MDGYCHGESVVVDMNLLLLIESQGTRLRTATEQQGVSEWCWVANID